MGFQVPLKSPRNSVLSRVLVVSDVYRNVAEVRGDQLSFRVGRAQTAPKTQQPSESLLEAFKESCCCQEKGLWTWGSDAA